jgi:predicted ribosome quality control (RQC) complex YloA/Tae2 family protein
MKEIINQETTYWIGRNAQDNWDIIKESKEKWVWIHLDKFPSGHVIICKDSDTVTDEEIIYGCNICISHSKYKNMQNMSVVYCEIKNLTLGEDVGSVYFKSNRKTNKKII